VDPGAPWWLFASTVGVSSAGTRKGILGLVTVAPFGKQWSLGLFPTWDPLVLPVKMVPGGSSGGPHLSLLLQLRIILCPGSWRWAHD
jgi:hypothetical protein